MVYRCKKEYIDLGFVCFSVNKDYKQVVNKWYQFILLDNYDREISIPIEIAFEYFYTPVELKGIKRKELIDKLLK